MDGSVINNRLEELDNILEFVEKKQDLVITTIHSLGWNLNSIIDEDVLMECSVNKQHMVPSSKLQVHVGKCSSNQNIFTHRNNQDTIEDPNISKCNKDDEHMNSDLTISNILQKIQDTSAKDDCNMSKTYLEELALIRDLKRRRLKYKVSTKSKSYTEVLREVISNQMDLHSSNISDISHRKKSQNSSR